MKFRVSQIETYLCESNLDQAQTQAHISYIKEMVMSLKTVQILILTLIALALTIFYLKNTENAPSNEILRQRIEQASTLLLNLSLMKSSLNLKNLALKIQKLLRIRRKR